MFKVANCAVGLVALFCIGVPAAAQPKDGRDAQSYRAKCEALIGWIGGGRGESAARLRETQIQRCIRNKGKVGGQVAPRLRPYSALSSSWRLSAVRSTSAALSG
jgi:hypothetical protein